MESTYAIHICGSEIPNKSHTSRYSEFVTDAGGTRHYPVPYLKKKKNAAESPPIHHEVAGVKAISEYLEEIFLMKVLILYLISGRMECIRDMQPILNMVAFMLAKIGFLDAG
jgi:hypothetical protein